MSTWKSILPYLQLSLGACQILQFTPFLGIIQGVIGWLLWPLFPDLFPSYALLRRFPGRVFKKVKCVVLTKAKPLTIAEKRPEAKKPDDKKPVAKKADKKKDEKKKPHESDGALWPPVSMWYLGEEFRVSRKRDKLFVNEKMSHYISGIQWGRIEEMEAKCFEKERENKVVFVIGYTPFWEKKVAGNVMTFEEVLDCVIFDETGVMIPSDADVGFLPVDLSDGSKKIISKLLNLVGLFFQAKKNKFSWYYPTIFSAASAVLELPPVSAWIYGKINKVFCRSVQCICDQLPYSVRRHVYSLGFWVENLRPCNDIQLKVVRGDISVVIGGAAKTDRDDADRVRWLRDLPGVFDHDQTDHGCIRFHHGCIHAYYDKTQKKCVASIKHNRNSEVSVKCTRSDMFHQICTFLESVADTKSGSLKSYDAKKKKVVVRRWRESVRHYVDAGCPPVYELKLEDVIVRGNF